MGDCEKVKCTVSGKDPENPITESVPTGRKLPNGQFADHWVLCESERAKGFIRPLRVSYRHIVCGTTTTMPMACAETYARQPSYYGSTFCYACGGYFPVGEQGEFTWTNSDEKVGA